MSNPVNEWIRGGNTPAGKDKRRYIVAGVCAAVGVIAAPFTYGISLILVVIAIIKVKNAIVDQT